MGRLLSRPGTIPAMIGTLILAQLAFVRLFFDATLGSVTFLGMAFGSACAFRQRFGVPCPSCGLTRGVVLALHGRLWEACEVNPGGPALVFGLIFFGVATLSLSVIPFDRSARNAVEDGIRWASLLAGGVFTALVVVHWVLELRRLL